MTHPRMREADADLLVKAAEQHFGLRSGDIRGASKDRVYSWPRQVVMVAGKRRLSWSYPQAARAVARINHTTALHADRRFTAAAEKGTQAKKDLDGVMKIFLQLQTDGAVS